MQLKELYSSKRIFIFFRDHPETIKKRFVSAFVMLFIAPCFLYMGLNREILEKVPIYTVYF